MAIEHDLAELIAMKDRYRADLKELCDFIERATDTELVHAQQYMPYADAKSLLLASE